MTGIVAGLSKTPVSRSFARPMISVVIPHYNSGELLTTTVKKVLESASLEEIQIEIVVIDDGSSHTHRSYLAKLASQQVRITYARRNLGRSGAVNLGVSEAAHELILVLDCDCHPGSRSFFSHHLQAIADADVSLGGLLKMKADFWGRYQDLAVERRIRKFNAGMPFLFTTPNMMIRKHFFQSVGGYDEAYKHYGFEDRDLLIRLQEAGARFVYSSGSPVIHCDGRTSLKSVAGKMREAGRCTSRIFSARHPDVYRLLGYSRIDVNYHPVLRAFSFLNAETLGKRIDPWLNILPFPLGVALTRVVTALAFLEGTAKAASGTAPKSTEPTA
ncbi:glycosyltransferase [Luteimonas sp. MJ246]|uniref:glycosyltransferase family 2 protein n=1 Tax=Luteimonas sp. MJ174 TaxID=3129237 RepID=UPI0031B9F012